MLNRREELIDIVKGIGIILVIIGHCNHFFTYESKPIVLIYGFHMPLFIFVSSILVFLTLDKNISVKDFCYKKCESIMRPYIIGCILSIAITCMLSGIIPQKEYLIGIFMGETVTGDLSFNLPLWFLPMLFCSNFITYMVLKRTKKIDLKYIITSVLCGSIGFMAIKTGKFHLWNLDIALLCQVFSLTGILTYKYIWNKISECKMSAIFILILIFLIIYVPVCIYNTRVDLNARRINNLILFLLNSHLGIGISLLIAEVIRRCNFIGSLFVLIGRNSLGILIWHIPFSSIFYACLVPAMPQYVQNFVWGGGRINYCDNYSVNL